MNHRIASCTLAVSAAFAGIYSASAFAAPTVAFKRPLSGNTISGSISNSTACEVGGTNISQVRFFIDGVALNTEANAPWNCTIDTRRYSNGTHALRAVAYDAAGASASTQVSVNIQNGTTTSTNAAPAVAFKAPLNGATVSGAISASACEASATDGNGIKQVQFYLDSTLVNTELTAPFNCSLDTRKFADGSHMLKAVATDALGATSTAQVGITIKNTVTTPPPVVTPPTTPTPTGPTVSWYAPAVNATLKGSIGASSACQVNGTGISKVVFSLDATALNTELTAPWQCTLDTRKFADGAHTLKAVAYNTSGAATTINRAVIIANGTVTTPTPNNVAPTVSLTAPAAGARISGKAVACAATASDSDGTVKSVEFMLGSKMLATATAAPYGCSIDTTTVANGTYNLMARATDNAGAVSTTQRSVTVDNTVTPPPVVTPPPPDSTLPSDGTNAIPTFESVGLYWKPGTNPGAAGCAVQYRKAGESAWKDGLAMWYDSRNSECRGSLVHLTPGTNYEARFALPGQAPSKGRTFTTWSENLPIARTVQVQSGSQMLNITEGGTKDGYVLYTGPATIDVGNAADHNVRISAPYVIVRGLTMKNARMDAVKMFPGAHDVVIEDNDISGWGRDSGGVSSDGWKIGTNADSGVKAMCNGDGPWLVRTIVQRNKIHDPRYGSNSWSDGHPQGPNAIAYFECGGNHVFRYNEIYSSWGHYFMDAIGAGENFSLKGFPNSDSDVYGNRIQHVWDDAIESEGANTNVRIWGNYMDQTATAIASTSTATGPLYVFRNVYNRGRNLSMKPLDSDQRLYAFKTGNSSVGNGRRYFFHNTLLQAAPLPGSIYPQGAGQGLSAPGGGQILTNTVSRNNIFQVWKTNWPSVQDLGGAGNDFDSDLVNGTVNAYAGAEPNRIVGTPKYAPGHGWQAEASGQYQLAPDSPGYDRGVRIPNFNDSFTGAAPDFGAHEAGWPAMKFGR